MLEKQAELDFPQEAQALVDSVQDWSEAVRWVDTAVKSKHRAMLEEGQIASAAALKEAWNRINRG
tara:strand:+ start:74 stop:268 length:195 start_codon:yes stop_codon:yes gene_type:complete